MKITKTKNWCLGLDLLKTITRLANVKLIDLENDDTIIDDDDDVIVEDDVIVDDDVFQTPHNDDDRIIEL